MRIVPDVVMAAPGSPRGRAQRTPVVVALGASPVACTGARGNVVVGVFAMRAIVVKGTGGPAPVFVIPDDATSADVAAAVLFLAAVGGFDVEVDPLVEATSLADFHRRVAAFGRGAPDCG